MNSHIIHTPIKFSIKTNNLDKIHQKLDKTLPKIAINKFDGKLHHSNDVFSNINTKPSSDKVDSYKAVGSLINGFPIVKKNSVDKDDVKKDAVKRSITENDDESIRKLRKFDESKDTVIIEPETSSKLVIHPLPKTVKISTKTEIEINETLREKFHKIDKICQAPVQSNIIKHEVINSAKKTEECQFPKINLTIQPKKIIVEKSLFNDSNESEDSRKKSDEVKSKSHHKVLKSLMEEKEKLLEKENKQSEKNHSKRQNSKERTKHRKNHRKSRDNEKDGDRTYRHSRDHDRNQKDHHRYDRYRDHNRDSGKWHRRRSNDKNRCYKSPPVSKKSKRSSPINNIITRVDKPTEYIVKDEYLDPSEQVLESSFTPSQINKSTKDRLKISENIRRLLNKKSANEPPTKSTLSTPSISPTDATCLPPKHLNDVPQHNMVTETPYIDSKHLGVTNDPIIPPNCPVDTKCVSPSPDPPIVPYIRTANISFKITPKKMQTGNIFSTPLSSDPTSATSVASAIVDLNQNHRLQTDNHQSETTFKVPFGLDKCVKRADKKISILDEYLEMNYATDSLPHCAALETVKSSDGPGLSNVSCKNLSKSDIATNHAVAIHDIAPSHAANESITIRAKSTQPQNTICEHHFSSDTGSNCPVTIRKTPTTHKADESVTVNSKSLTPPKEGSKHPPAIENQHHEPIKMNTLVTSPPARNQTAASPNVSQSNDNVSPKAKSNDKNKSSRPTREYISYKYRDKNHRRQHNHKVHRSYARRSSRSPDRGHRESGRHNLSSQHKSKSPNRRYRTKDHSPVISNRKRSIDQNWSYKHGRRYESKSKRKRSKDKALSSTRRDKSPRRKQSIDNSSSMTKHASPSMNNVRLEKDQETIRRRSIEDIDVSKKEHKLRENSKLSKSNKSKDQTSSTKVKYGDDSTLKPNQSNETTKSSTQSSSDCNTLDRKSELDIQSIPPPMPLDNYLATRALEVEPSASIHDVQIQTTSINKTVSSESTTVVFSNSTVAASNDNTIDGSIDTTKPSADGEQFLKHFLNRFVHNKNSPTITTMPDDTNGFYNLSNQFNVSYNQSNFYSKPFSAYNFPNSSNYPHVYNHSNYSLTNIFQPAVANTAYQPAFDNFWFLPQDFRSCSFNNSTMHNTQYHSTPITATYQSQLLPIISQPPPFVDSGSQLVSPTITAPSITLSCTENLLPITSIPEIAPGSCRSNEDLDMDLASEESCPSYDSRHAVDEDQLSDQDDLSSCGEFDFEPNSIPLDPFEKFPQAPRPQYEHIIETEVHKSAAGMRFEYAYLKSTVCNCVPPDPDEVVSGQTACGESCFNRRIKVECNRKCPVYELCTNRRFQEQMYMAIEPVYCTDGKGWGIRATNAIVPGTFIIEYVGELIDFDEFLRRVSSDGGPGGHHFIMAVQKDLYIDAGRKGNWSRFVNHSCDPNTIIERWVVDGKTRIGFFSKKHIGATEEITIDYQFQQYGMVEQHCFCASANCTGVMGKVNEKLQEQIRSSHNRQRRELVQRITTRSRLREIGHVSDMITVFKEESLDRNTFQAFLHVLLRTESELCIRAFIECGGLRVITSYLDSVPWNDWPVKLLYLRCIDHFRLKKRTIISDGVTAIDVVRNWAENARYTTRHLGTDDDKAATIEFVLDPANDDNAANDAEETEIRDLANNINQYFAEEKEKFYIPKKKMIHSDSLADLTLNDADCKSKDSASRASSVQGDYVRSKKIKIRRKCTEAIQKLSKDEFRRLFSERHEKLQVEKNQVAAPDNASSLSNLGVNSMDTFDLVKKFLSKIIIDEITRLKKSDKFSSMPVEFQNLDLDKIFSDLDISGNEEFMSIMNPGNETDNKPSSASTYSNSSSKSTDDVNSGVQKPPDLPPNWNWRRSESGRYYYYNIITKKTQWDIPVYPWDAGENDPMAYDFGHASRYPISREDVRMMYEEYKKKFKQQKIEDRRNRRLERSIQRKLNLSAGERNKIEFSKAVFRVVKIITKPYNSSACKVGRIQHKQDLKFLCEKFADTIINKETKLVASLEDLEMNANVHSKIKTYIDKYMANQGKVYKRSQKCKPKPSKQKQFGLDECKSVNQWLHDASQTEDSTSQQQSQLLSEIDISPQFSP